LGNGWEEGQETDSEALIGRDSFGGVFLVHMEFMERAGSREAFAGKNQGRIEMGQMK
jgi:hypothetical protein